MITKAEPVTTRTSFGGFLERASCCLVWVREREKNKQGTRKKGELAPTSGSDILSTKIGVESCLFSVRIELLFVFVVIRWLKTFLFCFMRTSGSVVDVQLKQNKKRTICESRKKQIEPILHLKRICSLAGTQTTSTRNNLSRVNLNSFYSGSGAKLFKFTLERLQCEVPGAFVSIMRANEGASAVKACGSDAQAPSSSLTLMESSIRLIMMRSRCAPVRDQAELWFPLKLFCFLAQTWPTCFSFSSLSCCCCSSQTKPSDSG